MAAVGGQVAKESAFSLRHCSIPRKSSSLWGGSKTVKLPQKTIGIKDKCNHNVKDLTGNATTKAKWYS